MTKEISKSIISNLSVWGNIYMSQILGLPLNTWLIVGGSFTLSTLAPLIVAIVIIRNKEKNNE